MTPRPEPPAARIDLFAMVAGGAAAALGAVVLLGWVVHSALLVQVVPSLAPMQVNTALGLLVCGVGLVLASVRRPGLTPLVVACGSAAVVLGLVTLIEYAAGIDLGIDRLLMEPYITVKTPDPGRMAPPTAMSFVLVGSGLLSMVRRRAPVASVCAAVILTVGAATVATYGVGYDTPFGSQSPVTTFMAVHTAAGFFVLGAGLLSLALTGRASEEKGLPGWLPYPVGAVSLTLAVLVWQILLMVQGIEIQQTVGFASRGFESEFRGLLESRVDALVRMAARWEDADGTPRTAWEADAERYIEHQPDYVTIAWADSAMRPRWSVRAGGTTDTEAASVVALAFTGRRRRAIEAGLESQSAERPAPIVAEGRPPDRARAVLMIYIPLFPEGAFDGFILGSIRLAMFGDEIGKGNADFSFGVFDGERQIFSTSEGHPAEEERWGQDAALEVYGLSWHVRAWPRPEWVAEKQTRLPQVVFAVAILVALLLPYTVRASQVATQRAARAESLAALLKDDISRRKEVEQSLGRTQIGVDCATDPIYWIREDGRILYANEAASDSIEYTLDELLLMTVSQIDPDYPPEAWPEHWEEMREAGSLTFQAHHRAKGGRVFPVEITTNFVLDGSGGFIWAYVHDITARLKAEADRQRAVEALVRTNAELEHFNKMAVGRELRMIELKREVNALLEEDGEPPAYDVAFAPDVAEEK